MYFYKKSRLSSRAALIVDDDLKQLARSLLLSVQIQVTEQRFESRRAVIVRDRAVLRRAFRRGVSAALIDRLFILAEVRFA